MYIKAYHGRIQNSPLWAGLDASIYGCVKGLLNAHGYSLLPQVGHIFKSVSAHTAPAEFVRELASFPLPEIDSRLQEGLKAANSLPWLSTGGQASRWDCAIIYAIASILQPRRIIETGTGIGATGYCALRGAQDAHLYTFDMERGGAGVDGVPYKRWGDLPRGGVGQFITEDMADRVSFIMGDIRDTLPAWVDAQHEGFKFERPDLVILDSAHTPEHQAFEANLLLPLIKSGSVMLCDDTTYGWSRFAKSYLNCGFLGGLRK